MFKNCLSFPHYLLKFGYLFCFIFSSKASNKLDKNHVHDNNSRIFSPRMDYDEWTPLGQGDPLKNDPTFDYVPPVLDRVQYWLDSSTTERSIKQDILVLGATARKTNSKSANQFLKIIDATEFNKTQNNLFKNYFIGNSGAELPENNETINFHRNITQFQNQNRTQPLNYFRSFYYNRKSRPHTIMLSGPVLLKQKNSVSYNNFDNFSNIKLNFAQSPLKLNAQTEKSTFLHKLQQHNDNNNNNNGDEIHTQQYQNSKNHSKYFKSKEETYINRDISKIDSIKNYTLPQYSTKKYNTTKSSILFEKINLNYQSTQAVLGGWLKVVTVSPSLLLKQPDNSWNTETIKYDLDPIEYEMGHPLSNFSNHEIIIGQNSNIFINRESNNNVDTIVGHRENSNLYVNYNPSEQTVLPQIDLLNINKNNTINNLYNTSLNVSNLSISNSNKMQVVINDSPTTLNKNHQEFIKDAISVIIPVNYDKQLQNSNLIEKLNKSKNNLNISIHTLINNIDKPMHIAKSSIYKNFTDPSNFLKNYTPQPFLFNRFIALNHSDLSLYPIKSSKRKANLTNQTYETDINRSPVPIKKLFALLGENSSLNTSINNIPFNNDIDITVRINRITEPQSSNHKFIEFTNSTIPPTTLKCQSIQVKNLSQHYSDFDSKFVTVSSLIQSSLPSPPPTSSLTTLKVNKQRTIIQSVLPKIKNNYNIKNVVNISKIMTTVLPLKKSTTISSLTTDPFFSHYKQPVKPIRGPMYLIIQGHSKVKTYKPLVNKFVIGNNHFLNNTRQKLVSQIKKFNNDIDQVR